ncbi:PepSY domain-containing protein [Streptomyces sp. WMMC940]|uniref:PepSY domain-containing protein n=1 Tax=Streptomyces sp. WMMC940 TaxID=3015153 RepID=UPI0022B6BDB3|nr:PepSY domain-containing protein [Streptomyces sp. WMMC940]MCZ7457918.1 PepSY domain-containing protein [Streptomyces sp. WMMC940]
MKRRKRAIAALTAALLAGGGTAAAFAVQDGDGDRGGAAQARAAKITISQAIDSALGAVPGTVTGACLDDGEWEVEVHGTDGDRHDVTLDAATGRITSTERSDGDGHAPSAQDAPVTAARAAEAAESAVPGTVTAVELDHADGPGAPVVWEAEVQGLDGREHELTVDAKTAKVSTEARKASGAESDEDTGRDGEADEHGDVDGQGDAGDHDGDSD